MSKRIKVDDRIKHDFSKDKGTVVAIRSEKSGYNYKIDWDSPNRPYNDWYQSKVLELL